ncbi:MAG: PQQ-binding-like beta-propeller repeat protein [Armatimonadota bacterium]
MMGTRLTVAAGLIGTCLLAAGLLWPAEDPDHALARQIIEATGVRGGLVVHLGCGDGKLTAALRASDSYLVHGLDSDPAKVARARQHIRSLGLYGEVSVEHWESAVLPYVDNLVNLLVAEDLGEVSMREVRRVLAPGGVAYLKIAGKWMSNTKPWPDDIDEWTHFLHDASNNAVAADQRVGSPRRMQWMAGPKRTRDHDALASMSAMTSSGGRVFYILDEGATSLVHRPPQWKLIARDAFNGVLLWKRDIPMWVPHLYFFRSGPVQMPRRLVSVGDRVYVTLGLDAPVTMLDAATGETLRTYPGSANAEEIICHEGTLLTVLGDPHAVNEEAPRVYGYWELSVEREPTAGKAIVAYEADTGRVLWRKTGSDLSRLVPLSLAAVGDRVVFLDGENLRCLALEDGQEMWHAPFATRGLFLRNYAPTVVAYEDVVMCLTWDRLWAFSMRDGRRLWGHKGAIGFASPGDLFAIDGLAWTVPMTAAIWRGNKLGADGKIKTGIPIPTETFLGNGGKEIWGIEIHTGEVKRSLPMSLLPGGHHHRCYRNKATRRYLICGRRGLEYLDLRGDEHVNNWWLRGICQYGVMPANGFIYVPPDPCQCFNFIKVNGLYALSAGSTLDDIGSGEGSSLETGPAYEGVLGRRPATPSMAALAPDSAREAHTALAWQPPIQGPDPAEWPMHRGNITRSGSTTTRVPTELETLWRTDIGGPLSAPVVAGNRLYLSATDEHTVHCLDARTGRPLWHFVAGGRVDSPPTIYDRLCVFGSADGSVYCLTADDGELVWRRRATPVDRRVIARNRLGSVWPVSGSVLIQEGVVYFAAGRSSYLDGGIRLYGLDVYSGRKLHEASVAAEPVYPGREPRGSGTGALPDILVSDGERLNMRQVQFDRHLRQLDAAEIRTLLATTGLLEDTWAHRQNWSLGVARKISSHARPGGLGTQARNANAHLGKLVVFDGEYAYAAKNPYTWLKYTGGVHQSAHDGHVHQKYSRYKSSYFPVGSRLCAWSNGRAAAADKGGARQARTELIWAVDDRIQPRAMVLAGDVLLVAGWLDALAIEERTGIALYPAAPDPRPAVLRALSTRDGKTITEYGLSREPVFDGMCAAYGRLFISLKDGTVLCMGASGQ